MIQINIFDIYSIDLYFVYTEYLVSTDEKFIR